jgi:tetratricopeptide (TPR) repeat protein
MSPEQLLATDLESGSGPSLIDARSDIFSLGLILYELLTGHHPFGPVPLKLSSPDLRKHLLDRHRSTPRPIRELNPLVDQGLARLVAQCMEYNPNDRPQSPAELAEALRCCLSPLRRLRRWSTAHPRQMAAALLFVTTMLAAGSASLAIMKSYAERQVDNSQRAYAAGSYDDAVRFANRAIEENPKSVDAYLARAHAYHRQHEWRSALADYANAERLAPNGGTEACIAYCKNNIGEHAEAAVYYQLAIERSGLTPAILNNLGFSYERTKQSYQDFKSADGWLALAVQLHPGLKEAHYNRGLIALQQAIANPFFDPRPGSAEMERALALAPAADLFYFAGTLHFRTAWNERLQHIIQLALAPNQPLMTAARAVAIQDRREVDRGFQLLGEAFQLGWDKGPWLKMDRRMTEYRDWPEYKALLAKPVPSSPPTTTERIVDPLQD